jgi:hypothetical protein
MISSKVSLSGDLRARVIRAPKAPLAWRAKQYSRPDFIYGTMANAAAKALSRLTGIPTLTSELRGRLIRVDGSAVDYGVLSRRVVTTAFVNFVVDQLQAETSVFGDFKFHDAGVGTTAADVADTAIETTDGESRATGTQTEGASANIYSTVGTISYTTTKAVTEHGLFNDATTGTLMDRHVFTAINVVNGDSIQFTYQLTVSAGG